MTMGCVHCDPSYHGPPVPNHCKHWEDLTEDECAICADNRRRDALAEIIETLGYSLLDEPDKVCDRRIWNANMRSHRVATDVLRGNDEPEARQETIRTLRNALEDITSLAVEVKDQNTPEFMEYLQERIAAVTKIWEETA
jgi:hypothetical protein